MISVAFLSVINAYRARFGDMNIECLYPGGLTYPFVSAIRVYAPQSIHSRAMYLCFLTTAAPFQQELPENVFKVLDPDIAGVDEVATNHPPSVRDVVWNGIGQDIIFKVVCLPGAPPEALDCGVRLLDGSSATRMSFRIEVQPAEHISDESKFGDRKEVHELESDPTISGIQRLSDIQVTTRVEILHTPDIS